jgi:hypothetical protein
LAGGVPACLDRDPNGGRHVEVVEKCGARAGDRSRGRAATAGRDVQILEQP